MNNFTKNNGLLSLKAFALTFLFSVSLINAQAPDVEFLQDTWKLSPVTGSMRVGDQGFGSSNWWSAPVGEDTVRDCFYDDEYVFHEDGSFENILQEETWLEGWQQEEDSIAQCGIPVAPHNNGSDFSYEILDDGDTEFLEIVVIGQGAYIGLPKAIVGSELGSSDDFVPADRVYSIRTVGENEIEVGINIGGNAYWTFSMVNSSWTEPEPEPTIDITFQVSMDGTEVSEAGVFVGGGALFGSHDSHPMTPVGDNIYAATITVPANSGSHYTYINGDWWDYKEDISGQGCSDPFSNNDRFIDWGEEDVLVSSCFGYCGDGNGFCFDLPEPTFVDVEFNVDMIDFEWEDGVKADTVWATGSFDGWSGRGLGLVDLDGDHIYSGSMPFHKNGGIVEYKFTINGWGTAESVAPVGSECDFYQEDGDESDNYGFFIEEEDIELPAYAFGQGCEVRDEDYVDYSDYAGIQFDSHNPMLSPRYGHAFTADDNFVYAISGYHYESYINPDGEADTIRTTLNTIERYNVDQGSWEIFETDNIIPRRYGDAQHSDGFIYVFGGQTSEEHIGLVERIDTQNGEVSVIDNPYHVSYGASAEFEGEIYIWGGQDEVDGEYKNSTYKLNTFTGEWTQLAEYPEFVNSLEGVAVDEYIYSFGGYGGSGNGVSDEIHRYNIAEDFWEFMGNTDIPVSSHSVALDYETDNIVITGGYAELTYSAVYDIDNNEYHRIENYDFIGRRHSGSVFLGETLFTFGGAQPSGYNENLDYTTLNSSQFGYIDYDEDNDGPDVCELVNCENLQFVHVMESDLLYEISDTLGVSYEDALNMVMNEEIEMWVFDFGADTIGPHYKGRFMPEYNDPSDTTFYYVAEYPYGIPESRVHYYWVWGTRDEAEQFTWGLGELMSGEECTAMAPEGIFNGLETRFWDPSQAQIDWEDPSEFWNFDSWNNCDYWQGPSVGDVVYFEKGNYADQTLEENQDRIADDVWLTRADNGWLFNAHYENSHSYMSPTRTLWASGSTDEQVSMDSYDSLVYVAEQNFTNIEGRWFSLYLEDHNEYYDVMFDSWTPGQNGGGFSYTRYSVDRPNFQDDVVFLGSFEGSDYFQVNQIVSWEDAHQFAEDFGGHLATLTSPEENEFVRNLLNWDSFGEYYIGLVDALQNGDGWSWVTGEPLEWVNWDDGQPDTPGGQNYGVLWSNGKWDDGDADMSFIVEVNQGPSGQPVSVTACHPFHVDNGYDQNFFGVDAGDLNLFNVGDEIVIAIGDQSHVFEVTSSSFPNDENCFDEDGFNNTAYIFIDEFIYEIFGEMLTTESFVYIDDHNESGIVDVVWNDAPGHLENVIESHGGSGTFRLEAGMTYFTLNTISVYDGSVLNIIGAENGDGRPATIQPVSDMEGNLYIDSGWPRTFFTVEGEFTELHLHNIIMNGIAANPSNGNIVSINATVDRGFHNKIVMDNCVVSHFESVAMMNLGTSADYHVTNTVFKDQLSWENGMFFGGVIWGAGNWMGTIDTIEFRHNTVSGIVGEALALYEHVDHGVVDHNTFSNITMGALFDVTANNLHFTNNLLYNVRAYGQSSYDITNWGVNWPGGKGQLETRNRALNGQSSGTYAMNRDSTIVDMSNRNIHYGNNIMVWSDELIDFMDNLAENPWSWETEGEDGVITMFNDNMFHSEDQLVVHGDTTLHLIERNVGVTSSNNEILSNQSVNMKLDGGHLDHLLNRVLDFRDDQNMSQIEHIEDTWIYEYDGNMYEVQWPLHIDMRYSSFSEAATFSNTGGPVGDPRWEPHNDTPPIDPVLTNYDLTMMNDEAYFEGSPNSLPELEIFDGLYLRLDFEQSEVDAPYGGQVGFFFDANMNGFLDSSDVNVFGDGRTAVVVDNSEDDMNPEIGIYEEIINVQEDFEPLTIQGARFFFAVLDVSDSIVDVKTIDPYSQFGQRITGQAVTPDSVGVAGLLFNAYSFEDIELWGITDINGYYDIGMSDNEDGGFILQSTHDYELDFNLSDDPTYERYVTLFKGDSGDSSYNYWDYGLYMPNSYSEGIQTVVLKKDAFVFGQVLDPFGNPIPNRYIDFRVDFSGEFESGQDSIYVWSTFESDDNGHYSFWTMSDAITEIWAYNMNNFGYYDSSLYVSSEFYDEEMDAYILNHDIQFPLPDQGDEVNLARNGGFEDGTDYWEFFGESGNWSIEMNGYPMHESEDLLEVYEGENALKLWGSFQNDGENWTDVSQTHFNILPGGTIKVSAKMMSHADDWIGGTDTSAGTNEVYLSIYFYDHYGYYLGEIYSNKFDGTFEPGEWHHFEAEGIVPDGAHYLYSGITFHQRDFREGSVFIDDFQLTMGSNFVQTARVEGHVFGEVYNEEMDYWFEDGLSNVNVQVYSDQNFYETTTDENGFYQLDVPADFVYYIHVDNPEGMVTSTFPEFYAEVGSYHYNDIYCYALENQFFFVYGSVLNADGFGLFDARVEFFDTYGDTMSWWDVYFTDFGGNFEAQLPYGIYDVKISLNAHEVLWVYDFEVVEHTEFGPVTLNLVTQFDGAVEGIISFTGQGPTQPTSANILLSSQNYEVNFESNEDGFFYADLLDGIYDISVYAPGYAYFFMPGAFEVAGGSVIYNIELFENGYAGPPEIVDLHDVPNDQGRQMRPVWQSGVPGDWEYFTQFSIWRKVVGVPFDLWDYVETVPWHGQHELYAAVVPTLGDSSMHENHQSTFMVTAHTDDVDFFVDSDPVTGVSIDNIHPSIPMNVVMNQDPGHVSLNWAGSEDVDFDYFNIYRQSFNSDESASIFTTIDSFYIDMEVSENGAYQYWVTTVDQSGLESEASSIVSVVLAADEQVGLPLEFALKQNYPNPFNPSTQIQYALPNEANVTISIYDITGRKVKTLVNEMQSAGYRTVMWNATNQVGRPVSAGMYIYTIQAGDFIQNRKMILMK